MKQKPERDKTALYAQQCFKDIIFVLIAQSMVYVLTLRYVTALKTTIIIRHIFQHLVKYSLLS